MILKEFKNKRIQLRASESDVNRLIEIADHLYINKSDAVRLAISNLYKQLFNS